MARALGGTRAASRRTAAAPPGLSACGRVALVVGILLASALVGGSPAAPDRAASVRGASGPCALLYGYDPQVASASNASNYTYPSAPTGASANGSSVAPPFNITVGEVRSAWASVCGSTSFAAAAANGSGGASFVAQLAWSSDRSSPTVSFLWGFGRVAPCNGSASSGNGSRVPNGSSCIYLELWGAVFTGPTQWSTSGPILRESPTGSGSPTGAPGPGNVTSAPAASTGAVGPGWLVDGLVVVALAAVALAAIAARRGRASRGTLPENPRPVGASPTTPAAPPPRADAAPAEPSEDPLADVF